MVNGTTASMRTARSGRPVAARTAATSRCGVQSATVSPSAGRYCRAYIHRPDPAGSSTSFGIPPDRGPAITFSAAPPSPRSARNCTVRKSASLPSSSTSMSSIRRVVLRAPSAPTRKRARTTVPSDSALDVRTDAVAFRHELARRAVEGSLPASMRMELNARVLAALSAVPRPQPGRRTGRAPMPKRSRSMGALDELGARPAAALVRRRWRHLGVSAVPRGPQPATRANPGGLTDRQTEILRLLARGLTNAEIAARLVVSVRTVDHHVSAVLQKLGVSRRRDAVVAAARLGLE
jgi:DNA-binding CsgD family transcriptional regulator